MTMRANDGVPALTEKEKQTLRLMVRGHDAKSIARALDLSVHTINERLRDARRKMAVSSSREAARLLLESEDAAARTTPEKLVDRLSREDGPAPGRQEDTAPIVGAARRSGRAFMLVGGLVMTLVLALLSLASSPEVVRAPEQAIAAPVDAAVVDAARRWLLLIDGSRWEDAYRETGAAFRTLNTLKLWTEASERVRPPLGAMLSRVLLSQQNLPAPPDGYEVVKFRTRFANKADAVETVTLDREGGTWRVVGVTIT